MSRFYEENLQWKTCFTEEENEFVFHVVIAALVFRLKTRTSATNLGLRLITESRQLVI